MIDAIERQDSGILLFILGYKDEGLVQYRKNESLFLQWLYRAKDNITIEGEKKIIIEIDTGYSSYLVHFSQLVALSQSNPKKVRVFYHEVVLPCFTAVREECTHLREINHKTMFKASNHAQHIATRALWSMAIIGITAMGIGLGFSLLLSNFIVKPLRQIMDATQEIAAGSYDVRVSAKSSDELGRLAIEFNAMAKKLKAYHDLNIKQIIAEKRKSEAIIRNIDDGIVVVDSEFKVTALNPTAAKILDTEPDVIQGSHFLEVVRSEQLFNYVKQAIESGQAPSIKEKENVFIVEQDKTRQYYQFSITPIHAKGGALLGVVLLLRDVTRLKELDRLKSEFVMNASHELRTPLTGLGMSIDLLQETAMNKLDNKEQKLLLAAHEELQRMKALVNDLLDLSKIEAGKMEMEFDKIRFYTLCEKAVELMKSQADEKSIELTYSANNKLPYVKADSNKITWVLVNLISNALRYTESKGYIRILAEQVSTHVHISVSDNGVGIPYEYQSRIFDKFVQVKTDKEAEGSGLGLAICKEIIRAHKGTIWVDSTPGKGSTFTFTLPIIE